MADKTPPRARKRPKQSRSLFTVNAIQQACLKILRDEGADKLTTQRIADVAGVNIASLYQYFPCKEAILSDVYDAALDDLAQLARQRFTEIQARANASLREGLAAIIDMECEQLLVLQELEPAFFKEYQHNFDAHQRIDQLTQSLNNPSWETWLDDWLCKHECTGNPKLRNLLLRQTLQGNLRIAVQQQPELLASNEFRDELLNLLMAYLQATPKPTNAS